MAAMLRSSQLRLSETALPSKSTPLHRCCNGSAAAGLQKLRKVNKEHSIASQRHGHRRSVVSASSSSLATSLFDPAYRTKIAEEYGFTQIGEPLPPNVTLKDLVDTIPPEAFKLTEWKAWRGLAISVCAYIAGIYCTAIAPWYLLPFAWALTGTAVTGLFCIGHECGHRSFSSNKLVEDIVGNLCLLPLIYPYEPWRFKHDHHHANTNKLYEDNAWIPLMKDEYAEMSKFFQFGHRLLYGPLRCFGTIYHWFDRHFGLSKFRRNELDRVKMSYGLVLGSMAIGWPLLIHLTGITGWVNFWLVPFLIFHSWMSTITIIHHVSPHIPFKDAKTWQGAHGQIGTVNCKYPKLFEILLHDINVHIPHHISPRIPFYNLRLASDALRARWGKYLNETYLNWRLVKLAYTQCHLYDEEKTYVPFDDGREESFLLGAARRLMPNTF